MTAHKIFDGAFVMYSDMHLKECTSYFQSSTDSSLLYIDHCREGRIESEIDNHAYSYLQENEMRVDDRRSHSGRFCFPLCHYHGMTLGFGKIMAIRLTGHPVIGYHEKKTTRRAQPWSRRNC